MARLSDYDFQLPPECIAQEPVSPRDAARLLVHQSNPARTEHRVVRDLVQELKPGDLLVLNETRVRSARLLGRRSSGGAVELLLLEPLVDPDLGAGQVAAQWSAMARPAARLRAGEQLSLEGGALVARMVRRDGALWCVEIRDPGRPGQSVDELLERCGRVPLPPYIERTADDPREADDRERYQTVYARVAGAVAAPTAGLHFTPSLLTEITERGIEIAKLSLHVGLGTFLPVTTEDTRDHDMHSEAFELPEATVQAVAECRGRGGRVVAVGTTSVRALESRADEEGQLSAGSGRTSLFIEPGYRFRVVDGLLTNFHLPRSTLLLLVSAFAGRERVLELYSQAIAAGYRFYSFGDAMLLWR